LGCSNKYIASSLSTNKIVEAYLENYTEEIITKSRALAVSMKSDKEGQEGRGGAEECVRIFNNYMMDSKWKPKYPSQKKWRIWRVAKLIGIVLGVSYLVSQAAYEHSPYSLRLKIDPDI